METGRVHAASFQRGPDRLDQVGLRGFAFLRRCAVLHSDTALYAVRRPNRSYASYANYCRGLEVNPPAAPPVSDKACVDRELATTVSTHERIRRHPTDAPRDVDALVAAFMSDAPVDEIIPIVDRIATAVDHWDDIPDRAIVELRSAIDLMCEGKACATISALLAARSELAAPPS